MIYTPNIIKSYINDPIIKDAAMDLCPNLQGAQYSTKVSITGARSKSSGIYVFAFL